MNQELKNYVEQAKATGQNDEQIKAELESKGWYRADIFEAFGHEKPKSFQMDNSLTPANEADHWHTAFQIFLVLGILQLLWLIWVSITLGGYMYASRFGDSHSILAFVLAYLPDALVTAALIILAVLFKKHKKVAVPISYAALCLSLISEIYPSKPFTSAIFLTIIAYLFWLTRQAQKQY